MPKLAICLMGATATGKTEVAVELAARYPLDIVSVDSALVYRYMDVGTAKPDAAILHRAPHQLIDIRDPEDPYSAGDFVRDAADAMAASHAAGRIPLLVGGTMMYFRALTEGIAELPGGDQAIRDRLDRSAEQHGWPAMHARLRKVDPESADRIKPYDSQRIQRALEVFEISGRSLTSWHEAPRSRVADDDIQFVKIALDIAERKLLHDRIEQRLEIMFNHGFVDEVVKLRERPNLTRDMPSMRCVGYRQVWTHLDGETSLDECQYRALVATRQLAKRQYTWLRSESELFFADALEATKVDAISRYLGTIHTIFA